MKAKKIVADFAAALQGSHKPSLFPQKTILYAPDASNILNSVLN